MPNACILIKKGYNYKGNSKIKIETNHIWLMIDQ